MTNLSLSAASTTLLLSLAEIGLRVTGAVPTYSLEYASPALWRLNPGPMLPGQVYTDRFRADLPYRVSINSVGLRGQELRRHKPPGTTRVLCLGDSYTYGTYVDDADTWPSQLQRELRRRHPGREIEVINGGVSGFTIVDELAFMREHGLELEPDVVVLAFCLNDLADLTRVVPQREALRLESEEAAASSLTPIKVLLRKTAVYNLLFSLKARASVALGKAPTTHLIDPKHLLKPRYTSEDLELFDQYRDHLRELKALLDRNRIQLVLMVFPYWEQLDPGVTNEAQRRLASIAGEVGVAAVDLLPSFRRLDPRGEICFLAPKDGHPSAAGYEKAVHELVATLEPVPGDLDRRQAVTSPP